MADYSSRPNARADWIPVEVGLGIATRTACRACHGLIEIADDGSMRDAIAVGDEFFHCGCIEAHHSEPTSIRPAYFIPKDQ